ncbi:hypothetical protein QOT17_019880 [Balamuthia mandrillaris]
MLLLWNTEKYDQAVQIALSIEANLYAYKTPSSTSCPLHPIARHSAAECKQIKQMKDGTQTSSKANTSQCHNGNNYGSSLSSSSLSGHPLSSNKHTCHKCSVPWHLDIFISATGFGTITTFSPFPSPALLPFGTNQPSTNALDASAKQEFMEAVYHAAIHLNSLLHPGNASDSAMNAPSRVVTPEAIHVEGLNTDDNIDVEDDCKDKAEPPISASILSNTPLNVPQLLQNTKTLAPKPKINNIELDDSQYLAPSCTSNDFVKDLLSKMVPSPNKHQQILEQPHSINHNGAESLLCKVLKEGYIWSNIPNDCHNTACYCKECLCFNVM